MFLAVVTGGFMYMRNSGIGPVGSLVAKGVLEERAPLVLTEFESRDPGLAATATEALRIDLSQSNVVKVVEPAVIARVLDRMQIESGTLLDEELAREIAIREGWPAVIVGEINEAGGRYVLSARLLAAEDGSELLSLRETAANESEIVPAVDELSARFREKVGESYGSLRESVPLEQVTTGSLDALRLYSQALEADDAGDDQRAIALLEEAVERDTAFAMAWRKLGVLLGNRNVEGGRAIEAEKRAFAHRDRLTTRERYLTEGTYYMDVERDRGRAITAYENLLDLNPEDAWALNNLGVLTGAMGDAGRALDLYERSFDADPTNVIALGNQSVQLKQSGPDGRCPRRPRPGPPDRPGCSGHGEPARGSGTRGRQLRARDHAVRLGCRAWGRQRVLELGRRGGSCTARCHAGPDRGSRGGACSRGSIPGGRGLGRDLSVALGMVGLDAAPRGPRIRLERQRSSMRRWTGIRPHRFLMVRRPC